MLDVVDQLLIAVTFAIAGLVKGVIGLGLPSISLGLLTATLGLQPAMALLLAPSLITNAWQAVQGAHGTSLWRRCWPFFLAATATIFIGVKLLSMVNVGIASALLGVLLSLYALNGLTRAQVHVNAAHESWVGPLLGGVNGVFTGMTGSFVVPGVLYLQALGLPRDALVQAMGILFTLSTIALGLALGGQRLLTWELGWASALAVLPAMLGMIVGQRVRQHLSEARFRRLFFVALLVLGVYIVVRALDRIGAMA